MNLEFEFAYRVTLKPPIEIGAGFYGKRMYWEIASGEVNGPRIKGALVGGSDWMIDTTDRFWRPHVRTQIRTTEGAYVGMSYDGLVEKSEAFLKAIESGSGTEWGATTTSGSARCWNRPIRITNGSIPCSSSAKGGWSFPVLSSTAFAGSLESKTGVRAPNAVSALRRAV